MTSRIEAVLAVAEDLVHRDQSAHQLAGPRRARPRPAARRRSSARSGARRRPAAAPTGRPSPATSGRCRGSRAGAASRRSARSRRSPTSNSPESWWRLICRRLNSSSMPGRHGQLLGGDVHHPAVGEQRAEPALDRAPVGLHLALGLHLLAPEQVADRGRVGPELGLERVGEAVGRVGREDDRAQARRRRSGARWRRRRSSCRRRPCPCRGSSAVAPSAASVDDPRRRDAGAFRRSRYAAAVLMQRIKEITT